MLKVFLRPALTTRPELMLFFVMLQKDELLVRKNGKKSLNSCVFPHRPPRRNGLHLIFGVACPSVAVIWFRRPFLVLFGASALPSVGLVKM